MSDVQVTGAGAVCLVLARGVGSSGRGEHSRGGVVLIREARMALSMGVHAASSRNQISSNLRSWRRMQEVSGEDVILGEVDARHWRWVGGSPCGAGSSSNGGRWWPRRSLLAHGVVG
jgi:hypothetical protein